MQTNVTLATQRALEEQLIDGTWKTGTRLPAERKLAEMLGVSRNSLREAIFSLKARGLLSSRRGSGVFVTDRLQSAISSPWRQLLADHPDLRLDTLEFRREHEGATAYYAALRATRGDLKKIGIIIGRLDAAYDAGNKNDEQLADADFHEAIAEASHNSMFLYLHSNMLRMLREHISLNLRSMAEDSGRTTRILREQHHRVFDAIRSKDPEAARRAMLEHIDFTKSELQKRARSKPTSAGHVKA
jgi:GntR family transcriptional repressor for pyruvate dehydrogenase complex